MAKIRKMPVEEEARRAVKRAAISARKRIKFLRQTAIAASRSLTYEEYMSRLEEMRVRREQGRLNPKAEQNKAYRQSTNGKEAGRRAYHRQKQRYTDRMDRHKASPCVDCGNHFIRDAMEFDHRDPSQKSFAMASLRNVSPELAEAEIAKCDIVCANCHRIRTRRRRKGLPATLPPPEYHI